MRRSLLGYGLLAAVLLPAAVSADPIDVIKIVNGGFWSAADSVPEPSSLALFGSVFLLGARTIRRRLKLDVAQDIAEDGR